MTITVKEEEIILSKERALFLPKESLLVISDLHLGKSAHFRKAGVQVPSSLAKNDLLRLSSIIEFYKPSTLLINGDMFHHEINTDIDNFAKWRETYPELKFILVKGNHDRLTNEYYKDLNIELEEQRYCTAKFCFIHDATMCRESSLYPISGHIHPGVTVIGKAKQRLKF
ncbi:MAG: ligase-associated DNA damage response endonuclease PdeM, partial [Bacteroidia bacterium]